MHHASGKHSSRTKYGRQGNQYSTPLKGGPKTANLARLDPSMVASALKVRNFKMLLEAAGNEENLALALDMNVPRIKELCAGENFSPETAYHIELTLDAPGFLDQVNPRISSELAQRLKDPLGVKSVKNDVVSLSALLPVDIASESKTAESQEAENAKMSSPVNSSSTEPSVLEDIVPTSSVAAPEQTQDTPVEASVPSSDETASAEAVMTAPANVTPRDATGTDSSTSSQPAIGRAPTTGIAMDNTNTEAETSTAEPTTAAASPAEAPSIMEVRRQNLALLTSRTGSKIRLAQVMNYSPANVSHRIQGLKKFDDAEAQRFTEALGLPHDWFDTPRTEADVPPAVFELLTPTSGRGRKAAAKTGASASAEPGVATTKPAKKAAAKKSARKKAAEATTQEAEAPVLTPADIQIPRLSAGLVGETEQSAAAAPAQQAQQPVEQTPMEVSEVRMLT